MFDVFWEETERSRRPFWAEGMAVTNLPIEALRGAYRGLSGQMRRGFTIPSVNSAVMSAKHTGM